MINLLVLEKHQIKSTTFFSLQSSQYLYCVLNNRSKIHNERFFNSLKLGYFWGSIHKNVMEKFHISKRQRNTPADSEIFRVAIYRSFCPELFCCHVQPIYVKILKRKKMATTVFPWRLYEGSGSVSFYSTS